MEPGADAEAEVGAEDDEDDEAMVHNWGIAPREVARHESRRGRRHAYERLDPRRTALVVVDMVAFFAVENPYCRGIVPNINRIAGALRGAGGTVAWVLPTSSPEPTTWATEFYGPQAAGAYAASVGDVAPSERLWPPLDGRADDVWAEKSSASAFFPGRSRLPGLLAARDVDTILVTGTVTNVCCESTVRDAATLGYRVILVADGTAAVDDRTHNATLHTVYRSFGDVRPTGEVLALIADR